MAKTWSEKEKKKYQEELFGLYIKRNKSLREISQILKISESTVFQRLKKFGIKTQPYLKKNYLKKRNDIIIPQKYSKKLAEFFGVMLGDGHLSHFQTVVTLGNKEETYAKHVSLLFKKLFGVGGKILMRKNGYRDIYLGSVLLTSWLFKQGLVHNKVKFQVDVPKWIFSRNDFMKNFLKGFFDTDGSIYKIKYGIQISFCNRSIPLLKSLQLILKKLRYKPSDISSSKVYLTKAEDITRFFSEIEPSNNKHKVRYLKIKKMRRSDSGYSSGL